MTWRVELEPPDSAIARALIDELSAALAGITGDDGRASFDPRDLDDPRAAFVIARDDRGEACGCGALRPLAGAPDTGELKRMFARVRGRGLGGALLAALERLAIARGYRTLVLSTRRINVDAVAFYRARGYAECAPYGRYVDRPASICLAREISSSDLRA